jgi:hypothetical protein
MFRRTIACWVSKEQYKWLKDNNLSATILFREALVRAGCPFEFIPDNRGRKPLVVTGKV